MTSGAFRVKVQGSGYSMPTEDGPLSVGFFATRHVKAENPEHAREVCLQRINKDLNDRGVRKLERASLTVEQLKPLTWVQDLLRDPDGFTFFEE